MVRINQIQIREQNDRVELYAYIQLGKKAIDSWKKMSHTIDRAMKGRYQDTYLDENYGFTMWYSVPKEYKDALCYERSDAFLVACLYFAIVVGEDIVCETPVTEKLLYQLREYMIPALCDTSKGYGRISIKAEVAEECKKNGSFVGTGISCGVDSFSTILLHQEGIVSDNFKITHLTLFNTGSMNFAGYDKNKSLQKWREETFREFSERIDIGKSVADEFNLEFIDVDTNISDLYQGCFLYSHTYRNCSVVLATQKMWNYYYYSSAGEDMQITARVDKDQAEYDLLGLPNISLEKLHFYSGGATLSRIQKTKLIVDNPIVKKYINVCTLETHNCGKCSKCIRTLMALDLLGKVEEYKECFQDIEYYKTNKWKIMVRVLEAEPEDYYNFEIKKYMISNKIGFDIRTKFCYAFYPVKKIYRIMKRKQYKVR